MSVQILGNHEEACMFCTTSMWAFGPVFSGTYADERARWFLRWYQETHEDPRRAADSLMESRYADWLALMEKTPGECFVCDQPVYKGERYAMTSHNNPFHVRCADEEDVLVEERILIAGTEAQKQRANLETCRLILR